MRRRSFAGGLIATLGTALAVLFVAQPAGAVTADQKLAVMSDWSQTSVSSYNSWLAGRNNQAAWSGYGFDWSTDFCSDSPDNPLGFDFSISCARHDFGYRNYKVMGIFPANKPRIDSYFYEDLKRKCGTYNVFVRPACSALAWTYYQAVKAFGSVRISAADLARAAALLPRIGIGASA
ncbi:MAG TPA: phospholipase [Mycobacteriales bacterium]|nr:phospholipase [Mycobacteriales bacterium]